jgi:hypothetical protein
VASSHGSHAGPSLIGLVVERQFHRSLSLRKRSDSRLQTVAATPFPRSAILRVGGRRKIRDGKVVEWRMFGPLEEALEAAGLQE